MMKKLPVRQCLGCREHLPKNQLVRIVRSPDGRVFADFSGKANGRRAYLCRNPECLKKAARSRALERALDVRLPEGMLDELAEAFAKNTGTQGKR